jgi:hypothetical protein
MLLEDNFPVIETADLLDLNVTNYNVTSDEIPDLKNLLKPEHD